MGHSKGSIFTVAGLGSFSKISDGRTLFFLKIVSHGNTLDF